MPGARRPSRRRYPGAAPEAARPPGALLTGDAAGFVNVPALKGVHTRCAPACSRPRLRSTPSAGSDSLGPGALEPYDAAIRDGFVYGSAAGSQHAAGLREGPRAWIDHRRAGNGLLRQGAEEEPEGQGDAEAPVSDGKESQYPAPDGVLTFDKLSSVYLSGNATRDDAPTTFACRSRYRASSRRRGCTCARPRCTR